MHERCYISAVPRHRPTESTSGPVRDPTTQSYWQPVREVQELMELGIAGLYAACGIEGVRPRFAYPLIRLAHTGSLSIKELAKSLGLTHSAVSQTVTALRTEGLVQTVPGPDARTRVVELTPKARDLVPFLKDEWRATEAAAAELDAALPVSLADFTAALRGQLEDRPFLDRILAHLPAREADGCGDGAHPGNDPTDSSS